MSSFAVELAQLICCRGVVHKFVKNYTPLSYNFLTRVDAGIAKLEREGIIIKLIEVNYHNIFVQKKIIRRFKHYSKNKIKYTKFCRICVRSIS